MSLITLRFKEKLQFIDTNRQLFFNFFYIQYTYYLIVEFYANNIIHITKTLNIEL